jgi:DNA polymerase-3 subunit epsilon
MREIVLDTETTGLDPRNGDRLVEIGGVELLDGFPTGRTFHVYINPDRTMPREAFQVHGLSDDFLADKPRFDDIADDFLAFVTDARLVIHNASFDMGFLNEELRRSGRRTLSDDAVLDTLALARRKFPGSPASLDALCSRFGVSTTHRTVHGALLDAGLLAEVYVELAGGRQAAFSLLSDAEVAALALGGRRAPARTRPVPLASRVTDEERAAHRAFVATLGTTAVWAYYLPPRIEAAE